MHPWSEVLQFTRVRTVTLKSSVWSSMNNKSMLWFLLTIQWLTHTNARETVKKLSEINTLSQKTCYFYIHIMKAKTERNFHNCSTLERKGILCINTVLVELFLIAFLDRTYPQIVYLLHSCPCTASQRCTPCSWSYSSHPPRPFSSYSALSPLP